MITSATITIYWPDSKWDSETENEYLANCLTNVVEEIKTRPIQQTTNRPLFNKYGREFARIVVAQDYTQDGE